jgi:YHS domain-containing protein
MKTFLFTRNFLVHALMSLGIAAQIGCDAEAKGDTYLVNIDKNGVILDGYDPVAFFRENKPVKGDPSHSYAWHDATYHFASAANKMEFEGNPEKYVPQYGGYCGYAVSLGHLAPIDVNYFSIVDGRLILQHNQRALDGWNTNAGSLQLADKYWPTFRKRKKSFWSMSVMTDLLPKDMMSWPTSPRINR